MKFKIGNIVRIKETGCIYPGYEELAEALGADIDGGKWTARRSGTGRIEGQRAEVLNVKSSEDDYVLIEIIDNNKNFGEQYIIGADGLMADEVSKLLPDTLFDI